MSERTTAREAPCIRWTHDRGAAAPPKKHLLNRMKTWQQLTHYAGFDWARDHHDIVVIDSQGRLSNQFRIEHTLAGWQELRQKIAAYPALGVAIETNQGAAVDQLLQIEGLTVYPIHPVAAQSYRQRKAPSGNKTDLVDAASLADALRLDGSQWKALQPLDPLTQQLRLLCRDEISLIEQRTALINQLQQALSEYYPAVLEAFEDWTRPATWAFVIEFPTPEILLKRWRSRWEKFLHKHKLWRPQTAEKRLEIFARADQFRGSSAVTAAKSLLAVSLSRMLRLLQNQLDEYRAQIEKLFEQHPDSGLFGSLPGAAQYLAPRLLGEVAGDPQRFDEPQALQCMAGTAPVSYQSGQIHKVRVRRQCNKVLRHTIHLWADCARHVTPWIQTYYRKKREEGKSHACALRCVGQRLLKILWKMVQDRTPYDADLHARNQLAHGSWVLQLTTQKPA
jgi:transposase